MYGTLVRCKEVEPKVGLLEENPKELVLTEDCILRLVGEFMRNPDLFWRESDVKCLLYHLLLSNMEMQKEYLTIDCKMTNLLHSEYTTNLGGFFDIAIFDPKTVGQYRLDGQKLLCGIEFGFDVGSEHFQNDFLLKFMKECSNSVDFGYIIHLMRDRQDWQATLGDIKNLMPPNAEFFIPPTKTGKYGIIVVKIKVNEQE